MQLTKNKFHSTNKKFLKSIANELGLNPDQYDLRSNKGGPAVMGDVILHTDKFYAIVPGDFSHTNEVMIRTCKSRKDYSGGMNNWVQKDNALNFIRTYML